MSTWKQLGLWVMALLASEVFCHLFLYEMIVVPRLNSTYAIPFWWWLATYLPVLGVLSAAGWLAQTWSRVAAYIAAGAFATTTTQWIAGYLDQPAHHKLIEGGPVHFALQFLVLVLLFSAVIVGVRLLILLLVWRRHSGQPSAPGDAPPKGVAPLS